MNISQILRAFGECRYAARISSSIPTLARVPVFGQRSKAPPPTKEIAKAILKDAHLIEAAIATDSIVISLDQNARRLFIGATSSVNALRKVVWVNPGNSDEQPIQWLQQGAKAEIKRRLGQES